MIRRLDDRVRVPQERVDRTALADTDGGSLASTPTGHFLKGDAADVVARLEQDVEENLVVFGSRVLVRSLMPRGLVDELVLMVLALGAGRRLLRDSGPRLVDLRLAGSVTTGTGVIIAVYQPAGG